MSDKCKWCEKDGNYSFGWLDVEGNWRDRHYACSEHAEVSARQQEHDCNLNALSQRMQAYSRPN